MSVLKPSLDFFSGRRRSRAEVVFPLRFSFKPSFLKRLRIGTGLRAWVVATVGCTVGTGAAVVTAVDPGRKRGRSALSMSAVSTSDAGFTAETFSIIPFSMPFLSIFRSGSSFFLVTCE